MVDPVWTCRKIACLSVMLGAVALAGAVAKSDSEPPRISGGTDSVGISGKEAIESWIHLLAPLEDSLVAGFDGGIDIGQALGPDPFLIAPAPFPLERDWVVLLRGSDEIALLDERFEMLHRLPAPPGPRSWAWIDSSHVVVGGEESRSLALYRVSPELQELARIEIATHGIRGVALDPESRIGFALDPVGDRALAFQVSFADSAQHSADRSGRRLTRRPELDLALPAGPLHAAFVNGSLITNSLLDHTLTVHRRTGDGWSADVSVTLDGPIWSIDVSARGDTLWIAAGGIEDRPLDRTGGEFGNIDSYLYLYRYLEDFGREWPREAGARYHDAATLERVGAWNLSELGVITPKRVLFDDDAIWASGYGGERIVRLPVRERSEAPAISLRCPPGISDFVLDREEAQLVTVSPLLDAITVLPLPEPALLVSPSPARTSRGAPVPGRTSSSRPSSGRHSPAPSSLAPKEPATYASTSLRSTPLSVDRTQRAALAELQLGELLVFTTLLTPQNRAEGDLSRFTCEACHFEGDVDGRTHFTGREHVFATTKPIRGLAHNVPFFSRAGSELLCDMVPAEFAVANQGRSDLHWITAEEHPWMRGTPSLPAEISPETQRRGMLRYLFELPVIANPRRRVAWTPLEEEGLRVFRDRCAACHLPVRTTRDERSRVPFEDWDEALSDTDTDLIWGAPFLMKTGIAPYVSPAGARVPSLRRLAWKRPYFTNGSARTIEEVLDRFRYQRGTGWHESEELEVESLTPGEKAALLALLGRF